MSQARPQMRFVNLDLQPRDREGLKKFIESKENNPWPMLEKLIQDGYKFQLGWDERAGCNVCNMSCTGGHSNNIGCIMPSRSDNPQEALWIALYKHFVVCGEEWPTGSDVNNAWG